MRIAIPLQSANRPVRVSIATPHSSGKTCRWRPLATCSACTPAQTRALPFVCATKTGTWVGAAGRSRQRLRLRSARTASARSCLYTRLRIRIGPFAGPTSARYLCGRRWPAGRVWRSLATGILWDMMRKERGEIS